MNRLRPWVLLQLVVPIAALVVAPSFFGDAFTRAMATLADPHAVLKWGLESSQGLLLRQAEIPVVMLVSAASAVALSALAGTGWWIGAIVVTIGALAAPRFGNWPLLVFLPLVLFNGVPPAVLGAAGARRLAWIPGSVLVAPALVAAALGVRPFVHRLLVGAFCGLLGLGWMWVDCLANYAAVRDGMEAWPESLLDPRITVVAQSPVGVRADWHSVQIVGDHAIVVGETRPRLIAFPLDGGPPVERALGTRWGPERSAPLDAETDVETGLTWVVSGPRELLELRWKDGAWHDVRRIPLPKQMSYAYLRRTPDDKLIVSSVQAGGNGPRLVLVGELPHLQDLHPVDLHLGSGRRLPMPREVAWLPKVGRLALAPEFGSGLYLAELDTGLAEPWIRTPTVDGKMVWMAGAERLLLALPSRVEMWVVDPVTGEVDWTIPTQPGVRAVAVDEARGLVVSASVLTGQILVQDLKTGAVRASLGTVMPMVRELALATDRGVAVLTTWAAVYRFPYADP